MQTRRQSMIEALLNTASGYILSVFVQLLVFPWFGVHLALSQNLALVAIFTLVSIARSYAWRRLFNHIHRPRA